MIAITGFEPFGRFTTNPSWEAIKEIEGAEQFRIPVTFGGAKLWGERIAERKPDLVIATGLSPSTRKLKVEAVALNIMHSEPGDNEGFSPKNLRIYDSGENCLFTSLPYEKIVEYLRNSGIPSRVSFSAGTYVCNTLYYSLLRNLRGRRAIFIHVPPTANEVKNCTDCWTIEEIRNAIEKVIEFTSRLSSP